ncbi:hypothetical protein VPH35_036269 [Triticum aestivum]
MEKSVEADGNRSGIIKPTRWRAQTRARAPLDLPRSPWSPGRSSAHRRPAGRLVSRIGRLLPVCSKVATREISPASRVGDGGRGGGGGGGAGRLGARCWSVRYVGVARLAVQSVLGLGTPRLPWRHA